MALRRAQRLTACEGAAPEICAVEAGSEDHAVLEAQLLHDVGLHPRRGGGCQRQKRHGGIPVSQRLLRYLVSLLHLLPHTLSATKGKMGASFASHGAVSKGCAR